MVEGLWIAIADCGRGGGVAGAGRLGVGGMGDGADRFIVLVNSWYWAQKKLMLFWVTN